MTITMVLMTMIGTKAIKKNINYRTTVRAFITINSDSDNKNDTSFSNNNDLRNKSSKQKRKKKKHQFLPMKW